MSKELEHQKILYSLNKIFDIAVHQGNKLVDIRTDYETIKSALEVLDIIVKKNVDVEMISYCSYVKSYNKALRPTLHLTQEEFDLIKEWVNEN